MRLRLSSFVRSTAFACALAACNAISGVGDLEFEGAGSVSAPSSGSASATGSSSGAGGIGVGGAAGSATASTSAGAQAGASTTTTSASASAGGAGGEGGSQAPCGDGMLDAGEQCDDGDALPGDGCSATCAIEGVDACPVPAVQLVTSTPLVISDTTAGAMADYESNCWGSQAPDLFFAVTPTRDGLIHASLTASFDSILSAHTSCGSMASEVDCSTVNPVTLDVPAMSGKTWYFVVDGDSGASGSFTLTLMLMP